MAFLFYGTQSINTCQALYRNMALSSLLPRWLHARDCPTEPETPDHVQSLVYFLLPVYCSEMGRCSGTSVEWNHQFSLLVDDANVEMLEVLVLDGYSSQGCQKSMARCKIPLMR